MNPDKTQLQESMPHLLSELHEHADTLAGYANFLIQRQSLFCQVMQLNTHDNN